MSVVSIQSRKKSWQTGRERVTVLAALAIQRETVVRVLTKLREDAGHPEKPGEPLPQDQAAARVHVAARTWQRWEAGDVIPYARHLSAIADEFGIDVGMFYESDAERPGTPDPFSGPGDRMTRIEQLLVERDERYQELIAQQNGLLARQSSILERIEGTLDRIEKALSREDDTRQALDDSAERLAASAQEAGKLLRELQDDGQRPAPARRARAKTGSPRASS